MRVLPPVTFEVRRPPWVRPMLLSLHLLVALTLIGWGVALSSHEDWTALWWAPLAGLAWLLAVGWMPLASGSLRWDGQNWHLTEPLLDAGPQREGSLAVALDAGSWLLLRFRPRGEPRRWSRSVWMVLARHASVDEWCTLRRTIYSARPEPAAPSAQAAANPPA
jgi:hypothetical protein